MLVLNVTVQFTAFPSSFPISRGDSLLTGPFLNKRQMGFVKHRVTQSPSARHTVHRFDSVPLSRVSVENVDVLCVADGLQLTPSPFFLCVFGNIEG